MARDTNDKPKPNRKSLNDLEAGQFPQERQVDPDSNEAPEPNREMREVWSRPGGPAHSYRNATNLGRGGFHTGGVTEGGHEDLTAAETPETDRHLRGEPRQDEQKPAGADSESGGGEER